MTSGFAAVTPELWVRQCRSMHYNTGVFISQGQAVLIDPGLMADMDFRLKAASQFDHQLNVESVFLELGGAADPQRVGWNKNWQTADIQWEPASDQ